MSTRASLAARLEEWCDTGGALDFDGPNSSHRRYAADSRRDLILEDVRDEYLAIQSDVGFEGRCAVLTAGPPGAGKTTLSERIGLGYRRIDADAIKDMLIKRALVDGSYDRLLEVSLLAGEPLHPRELSGLFHTESTAVADDVMSVALGRGEDIVLEGTLSWHPLIERLLDIFEAHRYRELTILSCDVPEVVAQERALQRWWTDRQAMADGLGGRFVPSRVINALYPKTVDSSQCRENADEMFERARGLFAEVVLKTVDLDGTDEQRHRSARPSR